ncbi:LPS export ABC transporter periplasmic protein LptC [Breoghania sp. L-A4]|uniref:LPS export ABC transporter periplasmic protein LptC n=1 Tax=Breoghania sp. L-A4 TaxID=2304600 RepID=UPI000E35D1A2|nr:LPS export ABC transporter periplasmic protein LptC [Breoghania sp. L-A4]AXS39147.1 LPS export ABC transporter periplasmic protein LptC [Breoghania sp. L-A4]
MTHGTMPGAHDMPAPDLPFLGREPGRTAPRASGRARLTGWRGHSAAHLARQRKAARRHSRRVRIMKMLLPAISGLLVLGVVGATALQSLLPGLDLGQIGLTGDGSIVMNNPKLSGHDGERSYQVSARRATQNLFTPKIIQLEEITARLKLSATEWAAITAAHGTYDSGAEQLALDDGIEIEWSRGYQATLSAATIDLKTGAILSDDSIDISSRHGHFRAGKIDVDQEGTTVRFSNGISMKLQPTALDKDFMSTSPGQETAPATETAQ